MGYLMAACFFIAAQAFFSGIETGLVSLRKSRVRHGVKNGVTGARILHFFITHPGYMLATTLVGTNISVVCASKMAKEGIASLGLEGTASMMGLTVVMTILLMAAEIIPKDWFRQSPYKRCLIFAYLLKGAYWLLYLPVRAMTTLSRWMTRLLKGAEEIENSEAALMREDFRLLLRESENGGIIDSEAADILDRALEFHGALAKEIFIPKEKVVDAPADMTVKEAVRLCSENNVSRLPVRTTEENIGNLSKWIAVFSLYDVIFSQSSDEWSGDEIKDHSRPLKSIHLDSTMASILMAAKNADSPLLAVSSGDGSDAKQVGIVTASDVVKRLFG